MRRLCETCSPSSFEGQAASVDGLPRMCRICHIANVAGHEVHAMLLAKSLQNHGRNSLDS